MTDRIFLPDVNDDTNDLLGHLLQKLDQKAPRNLLRASYYDGKRAVRQVGSIIPPQYYRLGIVLGWSAKAVDILSRRCNLSSFVWPDGDLASLGAPEVWDANMLGSEVDQGLVSSLIHSAAFVVTTKGDESIGEPPALVHFKSALNATGDWNPRRRGLENLLSITGRDKDGKPSSLALYMDGVTVVAEIEDGVWQTGVTEHPWGVPADVLAYRPTLDRPFGRSRISRPVMSLHDQGLRTVIRMEAHNDIYAIPDLWMFGADESIFKNADGSRKASWQVVMGRLKGIPDNEDVPDALARADVKQFPAASPEPHLAALNAFAKMFARETSLPDTAVAVTDVANPTSAESYDASQHELIAEAEGACDDWSPSLRRAYVRALAIANGVKREDIPPEWASINTKWVDPRYLSRAAEADAGMKQITASPWLADTEVGLELIGLDDQQIARALAEKRRAQGSGVLDRLRAAAGGAGNAPA